MARPGYRGGGRGGRGAAAVVGVRARVRGERAGGRSRLASERRGRSPRGASRGGGDTSRPRGSRRRDGVGSRVAGARLRRRRPPPRRARRRATPKKKKKKSAPKSAPLTGTLAAVRAACESLRADVAAKLAGAKRAPLAWRAKKAEAIKQFNPMYEEEGYQKGRDYDPNRERAEQRRLQRQLRQEACGAVRELRKDNRFLAEQRATEAAASAEERGERQRETLAFLEKMEGDLKSGGQGGMIVKTQRRVNGGGGRDRKKR